jgi:hypothetical protein
VKKKTGEYVHKDKCRLTVREYELRLIDENGDAQDVHYSDNPDELRRWATDFISSGEYPAAVIEYHVSRYPAHLFNDPDTYETIETIGDASALNAGGWLES